MRKFLTYFAVLLVCCPAFAQKSVLENMLIDAVSRYNEGNLDSARHILNLVAQADSTCDAAQYYLGMCDLNSNRTASAIRRLEKAAAMDSTNTWYRSSLASTYISVGDVEKAVPLLKRLLKENPGIYDNAYNRTMIGDYEFSHYRDTAALESYEKALEVDPGYAPAELGRADVFRVRGNMPGYFLCLGNVIGNPEVIPGAKSQILTSLFENMDSRFYWVWGEQLGRLVDTAVRMHPEDVQSHYLKGELMYIKQDYDGTLAEMETVAALAAAAKDTAKCVEAISMISEVHHRRGDEKQCFKACERALKVDPDYSPVLNNYAYYLSVQGRKLRKALEMSRKTIDKEPDNATYLDTYGWILHLLRKDKEAKPYFKHAMLYGGRSNKVILEHYSEVLKALGENDLSGYYKGLAEGMK